MGQIAEAKSKLAQAAAEEEQSRIKLGMSEKELKALEVKWKEVERESGESKKKVVAMRDEVEQSRKRINNCGWNADMEEASETKLRGLRQQVRELNDVGFLLIIAYF